MISSDKQAVRRIKIHGTFPDNLRFADMAKTIQAEQ